DEWRPRALSTNCAGVIRGFFVFFERKPRLDRPDSNFSYCRTTLVTLASDFGLPTTDYRVRGPTDRSVGPEHSTALTPRPFGGYKRRDGDRPPAFLLARVTACGYVPHRRATVSGPRLRRYVGQ